MADPPTPLRLVTFLLTKGTYIDPDYDTKSLVGVVDFIAINPDTKTNDRYEIAVEFDRDIDQKFYFEFRVVRLVGEEEPVAIYSAGWTFDPRESRPMRWTTFTFPSLAPASWHIGVPHLMELWMSDRRVGVRKVMCVPLEDSPAHNEGP